MGMPRAMMRRLRAMATKAGGGFELVLPASCLGCDTPLSFDSAKLCEACARELLSRTAQAYCRSCGLTAGRHLLVDGKCRACLDRRGGRAGGHDGFVRVGAYGGTLRRLILRFKHEFILDLFLGTRLRDAIIGAGPVAEGVSLWTPIPSHWRRRAVRGFHLTRLLTRTAVRGLPGGVAAVLEMTRHVERFHRGMSQARRAKAIHGAFRVSTAAQVAGRSVGLIDDVSTTGATLAEAARVLKTAGAARVVVAVLAKTSAYGDTVDLGGASD